MKKLHLPYVNLPQEFVTLLKSSLTASSGPEPILEVIRPNRALYSILENSFDEFHDGRGLEKLMLALGWFNFRDRMASVYIYKKIYGNYPAQTNMELVEEIKELESRFSSHGVHSYSRLFLLGFYFKMAQVQLREKADNPFLELNVPQEIGPLLKLSQGRTEKTDWLVLILMHMHIDIGPKLIANSLAQGKKFEDLYGFMTIEARRTMHDNLLAYGASIREQDIFLYDRI